MIVGVANNARFTVGTAQPVIEFELLKGQDALTVAGEMIHLERGQPAVGLADGSAVW